MSNENFRGLLEGTPTHMGLYGYHKHQEQKKFKIGKHLSLLLNTSHFQASFLSQTYGTSSILTTISLLLNLFSLQH